jgi:hypothetical protein
MGLISYAAFMTMAHASSRIHLASAIYTISCIANQTNAPLMRINARHALHGIWLIRTKRLKVLQIILMILLLVGFFGLFAALVFFSEGVIEPESKS